MRSKFPESGTNSLTDMHACAEAWSKEPEHAIIQRDAGVVSFHPQGKNVNYVTIMMGKVEQVGGLVTSVTRSSGIRL